MAQLTLYMPEKVLSRIRKEARVERVSMSHWVTEKLTALTATSWPKDYPSLFGALKRDNLERPAQPDTCLDKPNGGVECACHAKSPAVPAALHAAMR